MDGHEELPARAVAALTTGWTAADGPELAKRLDNAQQAYTSAVALYESTLGLVQISRLSLPQADYHQRRCDLAQRRYLAAVKALALVRKLGVPALQLNIARNQVNVAGPSVTADS